MITPWEAKAIHLIAKLCYRAWDAANPKGRNGQRPRKHRPYRIPSDAESLVKLLGSSDRASAENEAKAIFQRHAFGLVDWL